MQPLNMREFFNIITVKIVKTKLSPNKKPQKALLIGNKRRINDVSLHKL